MTAQAVLRLPTAGSTVVFLVLLAAVVAGVLGAHVVSASDRRRAMGTGLGFALVWLALTGALPWLVQGGGGLAQMAGLGAVLLAVLSMALSPYGRRVALGAPLILLVGLQVFRLPMELVLERWWREGFLPIQMTFWGDNLDIIVGIIAPLAAVWAWRCPHIRWPLWLFNIFGLAMLARIVVIVNMSSDTPLRAAFGGYDGGPDVALGLYFPYIWIASVAVCAALFLHVVALRRLWMTR